MKQIFTFIIFLLSSSIFAQDVRIEDIKFTNPELIEWGVDQTILNNAAVGQFSGVQTSNQTIYVAINDTLSTSNLGLVILTSTNDGNDWSAFPQGITHRGYYDKIKLVRSGLDSVYCIFQISGQIYIWNFLSSAMNILANEPYRTFDAAATSTGNLHVFVDVLSANQIRRFGSTNGGAVWASTGLVTSSGAVPKVFMSGTGDTLVLNYYGPVLADTSTSIIRAARYRETTPGQLSSAGFQDVVTDNVPKHEFMSVISNNEVYFLYTSGNPGVRDIMYKKSSDNGATYGTAAPLANNPNVDEYGIDGNFYKTSDISGFDFVFYKDSIQTGTPTNESDAVIHTSVSHGSTIFTSSERVSDFPPTYSENYSPKIVPLHFSTADAGIIWVGNNKTSWDRRTAVIPVELVSFTANTNGNVVVLGWCTASETNNHGFEIQRSSIKHSSGSAIRNQHSDWVVVGFVKGNGTTTEKQNYSFADNNLSVGIYSYRLKQIDFDGTINYSNEIEVDFSLPTEFALHQNFPNPFNPNTTISYSLPVANFVTLKIYNTLGEVVATLINNEWKEAGHHNYQLSTINYQLPSGVYFFQLEARGVDGKNFSSAKKLTLMK